MGNICTEPQNSQRHLSILVNQPNKQNSQNNGKNINDDFSDFYNSQALGAQKTNKIFENKSDQRSQENQTHFKSDFDRNPSLISLVNNLKKEDDLQSNFYENAKNNKPLNKSDNKLLVIEEKMKPRSSHIFFKEEDLSNKQKIQNENKKDKSFNQFFQKDDEFLKKSEIKLQRSSMINKNLKKNYPSKSKDINTRSKSNIKLSKSINTNKNYTSHYNHPLNYENSIKLNFLDPPINQNPRNSNHQNPQNPNFNSGIYQNLNFNSQFPQNPNFNSKINHSFGQNPSNYYNHDSKTQDPNNQQSKFNEKFANSNSKISNKNNTKTQVMNKEDMKKNSTFSNKSQIDNNINNNMRSNSQNPNNILIYPSNINIENQKPVDYTTTSLLKMKLQDGSTYNGESKYGIPEGVGRKDYLNGDFYEGKFENGKKNGQGVFTSKNFNYNGGFEDNLFSGKGLITYKNGNIFEGMFKAGLKEGKGLLKDKNGQILQEGEWIQDLFID